MAAPKVLAIVLAGGEGKRLMPLTAARAKPSVPFGGTYRLVDFALSNLVTDRYPWFQPESEEGNVPSPDWDQPLPPPSVA